MPCISKLQEKSNLLMVAAGMRALAYFNAFITGGLGKGDMPGGETKCSFVSHLIVWKICLN